MHTLQFHEFFWGFFASLISVSFFISSKLEFCEGFYLIITLMYTARDLDLDGLVGFGLVFVKSQVVLLPLLGQIRTQLKK